MNDEIVLTEHQAARVVVQIVENSYGNQPRAFRELVCNSVGAVIDQQMAGEEELLIEESDLSSLIKVTAELAAREIAKGA